MRLVQDARSPGSWLRRWHWPLAVVFLVGAGTDSRAAPVEPAFDDPLFRRCISWMLKGEGGALIDNLCIADYSIPPPSLFICARKVLAGFESDADRDGCALIFEEQARRARTGYVK
jgi:hypothetical protein